MRRWLVRGSEKEKTGALMLFDSDLNPPARQKKTTVIPSVTASEAGKVQMENWCWKALSCHLSQAFRSGQFGFSNKSSGKERQRR